MPDASDPDIDALLRAGDIEGAAALCRARGKLRRAAELLALAGRHAEGVMSALEAREFRLALDLALAASDERLTDAVCEELARDAGAAQAVAAHARVSHREDIAARLLEATAPLEAARGWYEAGEYLRAAQCFDRGGDAAGAVRALEQHLSQSPEDSAAAERLAELRASRGDDEGAVRALQAAVRPGPRPGALRKLVDALARIGLDGSARAVMRRLRGLDPDAPLELADYRGALPTSEGRAERYAGRYRVLRQVGSGATGRVLEALDELTGEPVALKILSVGDDRAGAFGRFMREAELARVLDDPTLVRMRALDPEGPTIVYDWMPGGTLAERIGALSIGEVRAVSLRLLAALETLHRHGIIHRDLKASNVLFDPAGQARLGDLGAAHLSDLGATVTGGLVGSLPYMSPEQITGAGLSAATDLYAFGCLLFQMLTGSLPFPGPDFVTQHLADPIPDVSEARPSLGIGYDATVAALLAKDPLARPPDVASARRLVQDLPWLEAAGGGRNAAPSAPPPRLSSMPPPPGSDASARLIPCASEGRWSDTRLGREVELVRVPRPLRELLLRWAGTSAADLQAVYDVTEDGDALVAWAEPRAGEPVPLAQLPTVERARIEQSLARAGVPRERAARAMVLRGAWTGTVVPLSLLVDE